MTSADDTPDVLAIGAILGDADLKSRAWKLEIQRLMNAVIDARPNEAASPLNVNVVFHVDGRLVPNEFTGVRTGRFDRKARHLMVQAAVPPGAPDPRVLQALLMDAIDEAERFARDRSIADDLSALREIAERASITN